jgi:hypothetical protein
MVGREWRPRGEPVEVEDYSFYFTGPSVEQAIPYGIYDLVRNTGWVNVGVDHDTAAQSSRSAAGANHAAASTTRPRRGC